MLYEVITILAVLALYVALILKEPDFGTAVVITASVVALLRITSYNVCYTKLLRSYFQNCVWSIN